MSHEDTRLLRRYPTHAAALDRIAELEGVRVPPLRARPLRLTPGQMRFVEALARRPGIVIGHETLIEILGLGECDAPLVLLRNHVSHSRRRLAPVGIEITTEPGTGYSMPAASAARWRSIVEAADGK